MSALYLTEEIEGGYFDKLRATPISRGSLVLGRLYAEVVMSVALTAVMIAVALLFDVRIRSGVAGVPGAAGDRRAVGRSVLGVHAVGVAQDPLRGGNQGASMVFFPLLFITPNLVPRNLLTRPMEIAATLNPVTYVMEATRSLILDGFDWPVLGRGFLVIGVALAVMLTLSVRMVNDYD
jgi:ABC-2 type transport system permease protein